MSAPWEMHPYQYVNQNPILYWDPDGMKASCSCGIFSEIGKLFSGSKNNSSSSKVKTGKMPTGNELIEPLERTEAGKTLLKNVGGVSWDNGKTGGKTKIFGSISRVPIVSNGNVFIPSAWAATPTGKRRNSALELHSAVLGHELQHIADQRDLMSETETSTFLGAIKAKFGQDKDAFMKWHEKYEKDGFRTQKTIEGELEGLKGVALDGYVNDSVKEWWGGQAEDGRTVEENYQGQGGQAEDLWRRANED